jgi:hypothetical protein
MHAAAASDEMAIEALDLFRTDGSQWRDPEMRRWDSGGSGVVAKFDWSA